MPTYPLGFKVLLCLFVLPVACRTPGKDPTAFTGTEDAGDGTTAALARAGVSLTDLPELGEGMPGDMFPPDDGLLPSTLPEYVEGMDDVLPGMADSGSSLPDAPGGWHRSGQSALREARAKNRPIVLWFANTQAGPLDNQIGAQVLFQPAVAKTLAETAVGLRIDFGSDTTRKSSYYQAFRKRYKITGFPTLVFLQPDGAETGRQVGFSPGTAEARIQNVQRSAEKASEAWKKRQSDLSKVGFRTWIDRQERKFFAKALRRDRSEAVLIDPFRQVFRVPLVRFSHESLVDLLDSLPEDRKTE